MKNKALLVTLADKNYVAQARQLFSSVYWNAGWKGDYMLLAHEIPDEDLQWFHQKGILIKKCPPLHANSISGTYPPSVLDKFYLFTPEFKKWNTVVFLDADIIVRYSLDELASVRGFHAVPEYHNFSLKHQFDHKSTDQSLLFEIQNSFKENSLAFNSGVMAFSTDIIRPESFNELVSLFLKYHRVSLYGEQLILNLFFYKQWHKLGFLYNVFVPIMIDHYHLSSRRISGCILHFCGIDKPWFQLNPFHNEWNKNLAMADSIDLNNRNLNVTTHLDAQKTLWLLARYRGNKIFFDFLYFVDRQIGKCGLILKRYYPSLYRFLRKNHRTNAVAIAGDYRINMIVEKYASKTPNFFFIQIGSNDGVTKDPLFGYIAKFGWKGILVEPVKYLFDKLKETYDFRDGLYFENVAIDVEDGVKALYRIKKSDTEGDPAYYEQIGSLKRSVVEKHRGEIPNFEERIMTENVRCISLQSLLSKYQVINIDLMHIDTEGNDYEIIRSIPFDVLRPKMILYEHVHLSADDQYACQNLLQSNGYRLLKTTYDTFAYLTID